MSDEELDRVREAVELTALPTEVAGVDEPVLSLAGNWRYCATPPDEFWCSSGIEDYWGSAAVPGEPAMQGFRVSYDVEAAYQVDLAVPQLDGRRMFLRFDGVESQARLWVDGTLVGSHLGGFTTWEVDITDRVTPDSAACLTVGVTDIRSRPSATSEFAMHNVGGILRDVKRVIVPESHLRGLHTEAVLDEDLNDASLEVSYELAGPMSTGLRVVLEVLDPAGERVVEVEGGFNSAAQVKRALAVAAPEKWNAEQPHLYMLIVSLKHGERLLQRIERAIGFRKIEVDGNRLLVNGTRVRLNGINVMQVHPELGRTNVPAVDRDDLRLFKEANINFVRFPTQPPSADFLDAADRLGMYVEAEAPVNFLPLDGLQFDPELRGQFVSECAEMVERDRDHPSVIIWSLGNESAWGPNIEETRRYVQRSDPSRPTIFSWPEITLRQWSKAFLLPPPEGADAGIVHRGTADIRSEHYLGLDVSPSVRLGRSDKPVIHDECAHVSNYNLDTLREDPGVRAFWGEQSLAVLVDRWRRIEGLAGWAIFAAVDEIFMLEDGPVGYGPWGILDVRRREKPEYWYVKKAYSPVEVLNDELVWRPGEETSVEIRNWYDFTDLGECTWHLLAADGEQQLPSTSLAPGAIGSLSVPVPAGCAAGEAVRLELRKPDGRRSVGAWEFVVDGSSAEMPSAHRSVERPGAALEVREESAERLELAGADFELAVDKSTGLIVEAGYRGRRFELAGPTLVLAPAFGGVEWEAKEVVVDHATGFTQIEMTGGCGGLDLRWAWQVTAAAEISARVTVVGGASGLRYPVGGLTELGVGFLLPSTTSSLRWRRRPTPYSGMPDDHIARTVGEAPRLSPDRTDPRRSPTGPWGNDSHNPLVDDADAQGRQATNDFRSMKHNVLCAQAIVGAGCAVHLDSEGQHAVRMREQAPGGPVELRVLSEWNYPSLSWGNRVLPPITLEDGWTAQARIRLVEDGVVSTGDGGPR